MKTIYSRYNRSRLAAFQTETAIVVDNGQKYVVKKALTKEAYHHLEKIYQGYCLQSKNIVSPTVKLPALVEKQESFMVLEYVEGTTFDRLLLEAVLSNQTNRFWNLVEQYHQFLTHSFQTTDKFSVTSETSVFFKRVNLEVIQNENLFICHPNADVILDNLIINEEGDYYLIDNEWIFEGTLPWSYIFFRSLIIFYQIKHAELSIHKFVPLEEIFEYYELSEKMRKEFEKMERNFQIYVNGSPSFAQIKQTYLKKRIAISAELEKSSGKLPVGENLFPYGIVQLFIDTGYGFNEAQSITQPITGKETQLEFELSSYQGIKQLRFDPLDDLTAVEIQQITVLTETGESQPITDYQTNALCQTEENLFIFEQPDSRILIPWHAETDPKQLVIFLKYVGIGKDIYRLLWERERLTVAQQEQELQRLLPPPYVAQLFIDTGLGFNESQSILHPVTGEETQLEFDLSTYSGIKQLRFDPLNDFTILENPEFRGLDDQGTWHQLVNFQTNLTYAKENSLVFRTNDPQIIIDVRHLHRPLKVVFQFKYVTLGEKTYRPLWDLEREQTQQLVGRVRQLEQTLQKPGGRGKGKVK